MRGSSGSNESDRAREALRTQGLSDFWHRPLWGNGYNYLTRAHETHVQILASAGVLGAIAYVLYFGSALKGGWDIRREYPDLGTAVWISTGVWLILGFMENQIADRYLYVPIGILVALLCRGSCDNDWSNETTSAAVHIPSSTLSAHISGPIVTN